MLIEIRMMFDLIYFHNVAENILGNTTLMEIIKPTGIALVEESMISIVLPTTALNTLTTERSLETAVKLILLPSNNPNTKVDIILSTHSVIMTTDASASTTAILIGVIGFMFVVMTLRGIFCLLIIILIQRRSKSLKKINNETSEKETSISWPREFDLKETDVNGEYEMIEDYMNTCKLTGTQEVDINLIKNQAYASIQQSS